MQGKAALQPVYLAPKDITPALLTMMTTGLPLFNEAGQLILLGPGIFPDIPNAFYHGQMKDYISSSYMKKFMKYPACVKKQTEVTDNMNVGSAIHAYSLEGREAFNREFAIIPADAPKKATSVQRTAKNPSQDAVDSMKWWDEFEKNCEGKTILPPTVAGVPVGDVIKGSDKALKDHPTVQMLLKTGMRETTIVWIDKDSGLLCKARADIFPDEKSFSLVDLKKTAEATRDAFIRQICNLNYDIQGGHYTNGVEANGRPVNNFIFVGVEDKFPFAVKTVYLGGTFITVKGERVRDPYLRPGEEGNAWLRRSQEKARDILLKIAECRDAGNFPSYELPQYPVPVGQITAMDLLEEAICPPWRFGYDFGDAA